MNRRLLAMFAFIATLALALAAAESPVPVPEVPYPDGYRTWRHICSAILPPKPADAAGESSQKKPAAPHGLIHHVYANEQALEGYRTGQFPEGAVLIADWFVLEPRGPELIQGPRKSINVMVRDARHTATGGWGFEDFDRDSHTKRNVGSNGAQMCFECHGHAKEHAYVFSQLKP